MFKSKTRENLTNKSNKKLLLKYSNSLLFEKREKEIIYNIKSIKSPKKSSGYNTIRNDFKNILISFPSYQNNDLNKVINQKKILKKNKTTSFLKFPLYLTEAYYLSNNNPNITSTKDISITCEETGSVKILKNIQREIKSAYQENPIEKIIDKKIILFHKRLKSHKKYIKKFFDQKNIELATNVKKEQKLILEEVNQNKLEYLEDIIKGLEKAKKLFDFQFIIKLANYVKFIKSLSDKEKRKYIFLLKEKMKHKKEIEELNYKIKKIESEKENILKWIYFFIKVKERKLILPNYYKNIIGTNYYDNILRINMKIKTNESSKQEFSKALLRNSRKISKKKNTVIAETSLNKKSSEKSINLNNNTRNNNINYLRKKIKNDLSSQYCFVDKEKVTKLEIERIIGFKLNLVFKTPEEFVESIDSLNNHNLLLLQSYDQLEMNLNLSKKELINIEKEKKGSIVIVSDDQMKEKQNELKKLIKKNEVLKTHLNKLRSKKTLTKKFISRKSLSCKSLSDKKKIKVDFNLFKNKIFNKITKIYESCKTFSNKNLVDKLNRNLKKITSKESEIMFILEYIECLVDFLKESKRLYINEGIDLQLLNNLIMEIDKKRKLEKPDKQKLEDIIKNQKLKKIIQSRNNKILFLPLRKVDSYRGLKRRKKIKDLKKIIDDDFPKVDSFIEKMFYDIDENGTETDTKSNTNYKRFYASK